tara:strand:- start:1640 stop:3244 length:1605 start_codon:yes stop_codon:yes gene_type:complete
MPQKKDPNKTPSKNSKKRQQIRSKEFNGVRVIEEKNLVNGRIYFKTACSLPECPPERKFKAGFKSWKEAKSHAYDLSNDIETGRANKTDPLVLNNLKRLASKVETAEIINVLIAKSEWLNQQSPKKKVFGSSANIQLTDYDAIENIFSAGAILYQSLFELNEKRNDKKLEHLGVEIAVQNFHDHEMKKLRFKSAPKIEKFLGELLKEKKEKFDKGKIGRKTIDEWYRVIRNLQNWFGNSSSKEDGHNLRLRAKRGIESAINETGKDKGKPWSENTQNKYAKKVKDFGDYMVKEVHSDSAWPRNPFHSLPEKEFPRTNQTKAETLTVEETKRIFEVASRDENKVIIPYLSFLFFAGPRPYEIVDQDDPSWRRFHYKLMNDWKNTCLITGGVMFEIHGQDAQQRRTSKKLKDRFPILTKNGVEWIRWALGRLPKRGQVEWSESTWNRVRKEALEYDNPETRFDRWPQDVARHTMSSFARHSTHFKNDPMGNEQYWCRALGHKPEVMREKYNAPKLPEDCEAYFNIFPPAQKESKES